MNDCKYDVSISFAGENREYAEKLANALRQRNLKVFYDRWFQASLWGKDLYKLLSKIYSKKSLFAITIFSENYIEKPWSRHELKFIQERAFLEDGYWLPLLLDDVDIPGLPKTVGYITARQFSVEQIADMVLEKVVNHLSLDPHSEEFESSLKTMEIVNENGEVEIVEVLFTFSFEDIKKEYVIYSKNEYDEENATIYISELNRLVDPPMLIGIDNEDEWARIRMLLRELGSDEELSIDDILKEPIMDEDGIEIL